MPLSRNISNSCIANRFLSKSLNFTILARFYLFQVFGSDIKSPTRTLFLIHCNKDIQCNSHQKNQLGLGTVKGVRNFWHFAWKAKFECIFTNISGHGAYFPKPIFGLKLFIFIFFGFIEESWNLKKEKKIVVRVVHMKFLNILNGQNIKYLHFFTARY